MLEARDHTVSQEDFAIWYCKNCTVRFTQDIPGPDHIGLYYESEQYVSHSDTRKGIINRLYHRIRKRTLGTKWKWVKQGTGLEMGHLLDIGCGTGAFLNTMKSHGWQIKGLEPDPGARQRAKQWYGLNILSTTALENLDTALFDAITLWHVLEHVHDLHRIIGQLKRVLKPGGTIFIAVPNYTSLDARHYGPDWAAYDVPRHLYHFSPASMEYLMDMHALSLHQLYPMVFDSYYVSLLSEKYLHHSFGLIRGGWTGLRSVLNALGDPRASSSLVYVCKQSPLESPAK